MNSYQRNENLQASTFMPYYTIQQLKSVREGVIKPRETMRVWENGGCYLSCHKAVITFSLPNWNLPTLCLVVIDIWITWYSCHDNGLCLPRLSHKHGWRMGESKLIQNETGELYCHKFPCNHNENSIENDCIIKINNLNIR